MRIFFLFLLILNILFAGWLYTQPDKPPATIRPLPEGLATVELLKSPADSVDPAIAGDVDGPADEQAGPAEDSPQAPQEKNLQCYTLGPFSEEAALQDLKARLSEQVDNLQVRRREEREPHRYWVYLPPQHSREQAIAMSKALARKKVKDYYIIRSGEKNNAVSLGHFREKMHADRRVSRLRKMDFDVQVEVIYRQYSLFWLDYSIDGSQQLADELIAPYLTDGAARLDRACN